MYLVQFANENHNSKLSVSTGFEVQDRFKLVHVNGPSSGLDSAKHLNICTAFSTWSARFLSWSRDLDALYLVQTSYFSLRLAGKELFINISWGLLLYRNWKSTFEVQSMPEDYKYIMADVKSLWMSCFLNWKKLQHARRGTLIYLGLEVRFVLFF